MKNSLIAAALAGLFAVPAFAQTAPAEAATAAPAAESAARVRPALDLPSGPAKAGTSARFGNFLSVNHVDVEIYYANTTHPIPTTREAVDLLPQR